MLLASDGTVITGQPLGAAIINNSPFTSQVRLTYNPSDVLRAVAGGALLINGPPAANPGSVPAGQTFTGGAFSQQGTVRQVISPTASAGAFHDPAKGAVKQRWIRLPQGQKANVKFAETSDVGQVRIARLDSPEDEAGYWSYVGTEILEKAK